MNGQMVGKVGAIAITIAVVSNSITKTGIAISSGGWKFGKLVALSLAQRPWWAWPMAVIV